MKDAELVDVLDLAGRIIANPRRARVSLAGEVALAHAVETFWEVALEADLLVRALNGTGPDPDVRNQTVRQRSAQITRLIAAIRGETPKE